MLVDVVIWYLVLNPFIYLVQFSFYLMVKNLVSIEGDDPVAGKILEDFLTFMKGFVSLPLQIPGTAYAKAVKVIIFHASIFIVISSN